MKIILFSLFLGLSAFAGIIRKEKAYDLLPAPLNAFETHKTTLSEAEQKLGKANLIEGQDYYWEKDGMKYALKMSFDKKSVLDSLHYTFTDKPLLSKLGVIDTKKLEPYVSSGKTTKYFILREKNSEYVIDPLNKTIYSVKIP